MTAIVGSYPKPEYICPHSGRKLLDECGMTFYEIEKEIGAKEFEKLMDKAAIAAIEDQNSANIDFVSDGEIRRCHYAFYVLRGLKGFDFEHLKRKNIRNGIYQRMLPTVKEKIAYNGPIVINDYEFTRKFAKRIPKITLPGPLTVLDCTVDDYYRNEMRQLAMDYADAIRNEIKSLIEIGCQVIQFDDPVLLRQPDLVLEWGLSALQSCFCGFEDQALFFVHICRGYPDKGLEEKGISYKTESDYYGDVLKWFSKSTIDVVSIEWAQDNWDLSILPAIGEKSVMLGVLDVGTNEIESVESIVESGKKALKYIKKEQLILSPDCGMLLLSNTAAKQKLSNIATAASILNGSI